MTINKSIIGKISVAVLLVASLVVSVYGIDNFWIALHNFDLCSNEQLIENNVQQIFDEPNYKLTETRIDGVEWSLDNCYLNGFGNMHSFFLCCLCWNAFNRIFAWDIDNKLF